MEAWIPDEVWPEKGRYCASHQKVSSWLNRKCYPRATHASIGSGSDVVGYIRGRQLYPFTFSDKAGSYLQECQPVCYFFMNSGATSKTPSSMFIVQYGSGGGARVTKAYRETTRSCQRNYERVAHRSWVVAKHLRKKGKEQRSSQGKYTGAAMNNFPNYLSHNWSSTVKMRTNSKIN